VNDSRIAALRAMAHADESPFERDAARARLAEAGIPVDPPRPPAPPAAPAPGPGPRWWTATATVNVAWVHVAWASDGVNNL